MDGFSTGRKIEHSFNGRQKTVFASPDVKYRIDGYHSESQTAYQFQGCYWHGHGCRLDRNKDAEDKKGRRLRTQRVSSTLKDKGYTVEEMWECEWRDPMRRNSQIFRFLEENIILQTKHTNLTGLQMLNAIAKDEIFGLIECDIEVPLWNNQLIEYFSEFPPICKNVTISRDQIGPHAGIRRGAWILAETHEMFNQ